MKIRILALAFCALLVPFAATSCSDDNKKISESDLSERLQDEGDVPKEIADCMAGPLADAGITEGDVEKDELTDLSEEKQKAIAAAQEKCFDTEVPTP